MKILVAYLRPHFALLLILAVLISIGVVFLARQSEVRRRLIAGGFVPRSGAKRKPHWFRFIALLLLITVAMIALFNWILRILPATVDQDALWWLNQLRAILT